MNHAQIQAKSRGFSVHEQETGHLEPKEHQGTFNLVEIDVKFVYDLDEILGF